MSRLPITLYAWVTPPPGYDTDPERILHPQSTQVHYVSRHFMQSILAARKIYRPIVMGAARAERLDRTARHVKMSIKQVEALLFHDSMLWADCMDHLGAAGREDFAYALLAEYRSILSRRGWLDFSVPMAGVILERKAKNA